MANRLNQSSFVWDRCHGAITDLSGRLSVPLTDIPEGLVEAATNVDIYPRGVLYPRSGLVLAPTSGTSPSTGIRYLFSEIYSNGIEGLWAWSSNGSASPTTVNVFFSGSWTSYSLSDTVAAVNSPHAVAYNGKRFWAYNSDVNRLHVYESGASLRRVGVDQPSAPTVANTGAGAYAATIRYYKVQMRVITNSVTQASSELSASQSFTPSGAGTAARVTKPTTVDSATHWVVYASPDNITFRDISGNIAVGTTTYDDSATPSAYTGTVAPEVGLFVPPPSCKYLATDGTRLLMAGAWETSATSSQTTPKANRVWFTRPLGATDQGDDESITSTSARRYWIDINDPNAAEITALQVIGGMTYVFFSEALWRLVPTGLEDTPYRAEQVSATIGAESQYATCVGSSTSGEDVIYFFSLRTGLYRVGANSGVEWLGRDVVPRTPSSYASSVRLAFDRNRRDLWVIVTAGITGTYQIAVDYLRMVDGEIHGGGRKFVSANASVDIQCAASYAGVFYVGGGTSSDSLYYLSNTNETDDGTAVTASVTGPTWGDGLSRMSVEEPTVQVGHVSGGGMALTTTYTDPYALSGISASTVSTTWTGWGTTGHERVYGLVYADAAFVKMGLSSVGYPLTRIERVRVPYRTQEAR